MRLFHTRSCLVLCIFSSDLTGGCWCRCGFYLFDHRQWNTEVKGQTLWFRGKHVLKAMATDLLTNRDLKSSTDVVISGCSAGGLATL